MTGTTAESNQHVGGHEPDDLTGTPWADLSAGTLPPAPPPVDTSDVLGTLDAVQGEMDGLRAELGALRRRDDTLHQYMQRLDDELRLAARLQQDFLPRSLPEVGPIRFHALWRPAGYVSGDLYDVMRLDERHVAFYLADAVGHGMPAALLAMFVKHALVTKDIAPPAPGSSPSCVGCPVGGRGYRLLDPGEALARLNAALMDQHLPHASFATALYGVIDTDTLELRLAKAGHPNPLLLRADGAIESLDADGPLLGIFDDATFDTQSVRLRPGDRLLAFTDGIEVAFAEDAPQRGSNAPPPPADDPCWRRELVRRRNLPAAGLVGDVVDRLDAESGSLDPRDDVTMLVVDVLP